MCLACEVAEKGVKIIEDRAANYTANDTYNSQSDANY